MAKKKQITDEQFRELVKASKPLRAYLRKYHNPHSFAIVNTDQVEIVEGVCQISDLYNYDNGLNKDIIMGIPKED